VATVVHAVRMPMASSALNLAPALDVPDALLEHADLLVVNDTEALHYGERLHRGAAGWR
jgi:sugar/nucleoside kinase (ribokinase family)